MYIYLTSDIVPGGKRGELLHRMTAGIGSNSEEKLQKTNDWILNSAAPKETAIFKVQFYRGPVTFLSSYCCCVYCYAT